jgi:hypothetical protein
MLLRRDDTNPRHWIVAGQIFLLAGLLASNLAGGGIVDGLLGVAAPDWLEGLADGLSLPMFGASIFFQLRGVALSRQEGG